MQATVIHSHNPLQPHRGAERFTISKPLAVSEVIDDLELRFERPYICIVNGEPILRPRWPELVVNDRDLVIFAELVQDGGGGGSNPLKVVAMIALVVVAAEFGPALGASILGAGATGAATLGSGLIMMGGTALISAAMPPPGLPSPQKMASLASPSPTYNLQAQGNQARVGSPIPSWYGRNRIFPDYGATPYADFRGNDQYLYQLFCVGQGSYSIEAQNIEDTPIVNFAEITTEVVGPGGTVTLFPTDVITSVEVSGQELLTNTTVGPFIANTAGTISDKFAIDIFCPRGLFYANDAGGLDNRTVSWRVEYQQVDDLGAPVGNWITAGNETLTRATNTPQRRSYEYTVAVPRYQVRLTRTNSKDTSSRAGNDLNWGGLRAYIPGDQQYGDVTMIAVKMRATNNLSQQSSRKFNIIATRELPAWSTAGGWTAKAATRNPAWAIADAAKATYGGKLADSQINLPALETLAATWDSRNDYFDGGFDQALVLFEALTQMAYAGRAKPYVQAGMLQVVRDEPVTLPAASFCGRNILQGDISVTYHTPTPDTADEVIVEYLDGDTWTTQTVTSDLTGANPANPVKVPYFGITNRAQAYREAMFLAACNRYRRKTGGFPVELEGNLLSLLDLAEVTHDIIGWGQGGEVTNWDAANKILTLSDDLTWAAGDHFISLRGRNGRMNGPFPATAGAAANQVVVAAGLGAFVPDTGDGRERTYYQFGPSNKRAQEYRVTGIHPQSENKIMLTVVNENPLVHTADQTPVPAPPAAWNLPKTPNKPVMGPLTVAQGGTVDAPVLHISWAPVRGADHYIIQQSADNFDWTPVGNTADSKFQFAVAAGYVYLSVIAVGLTAGDPVFWQGTAGPLAPPGDITNLVLVGDADGDVRRIKWDPTARATGYTVEVWAGGVGRRSENITTNNYAYSVDDAYTDGGPWRDVTFKVKALGIFGNSDNWVSLLTSNSAPTMAGHLPTLTPVYRGLQVDWEAIACTDKDLKKYIVYCGTTNPPTAPVATVGAETTSVLVPNLDPDLVYYVQVEPWDSFGAGLRSDIPGGQPAVIPPADVNVELSASITMSDSMGTAATTLAKLYDRNVTTDGVSYSLGGADKWIQYLFGLTNYIDRVITHVANGTAQVYFAYSDDGQVWHWLAAEADHTLTATGELVAYADQVTASANYWQMAAGMNVAVLPQRITAKYCRLYMTGVWSDEFYELVFARQVIAEEVATKYLSSLSEKIGILYSDNYDPVAKTGIMLDGVGGLANLYDVTLQVTSWGDLSSAAGDAPAANADQTQGALQAGTTITGGGVTLNGGSGQFIVKDAAGTVRAMLGYIT